MIETRLGDWQKPVFPSRCSVCGSNTPRGNALFLADMRASTGPWLEVPCCVSCATRVHVLRMTRAGVAIAATALPFAPYFVATSMGLPKMTAIALGVAVFVAGLPFWMRLHSAIRPAFDLSFEDGMATYRFQNDSVGREFSKLNPPGEPPVPEGTGGEPPWRFQVSTSLPPSMANQPKFQDIILTAGEMARAPVPLRDKADGRVLGKISPAEFKFLAMELQAESEADRDFYIEEGTLAMLEADGGPERLIVMLRSGFRGRDGYEVTW